MKVMVVWKTIPGNSRLRLNSFWLAAVQSLLVRKPWGVGMRRVQPSTGISSSQVTSLSWPSTWLSGPMSWYVTSIR